VKEDGKPGEKRKAERRGGGGDAEQKPQPKPHADAVAAAIMATTLLRILRRRVAAPMLRSFSSRPLPSQVTVPRFST
jgi:hypothetical protein